MQDLRKDWTRWSKAERLAAMLIITALAVVVPALLVGEVSSAGAHASSQIGRSL